MTNQPIPAPMPLGDADDTDRSEAVVTREVDGDEVLDRDANDDLVDSAEADRIASGAEERD